MANTNRTVAALSVLLSFSLVACDPDDEVAEHFASFGLNQLAIPTTGIEPGAVFLSYDNRPAHMDNLLDHAQQIAGIPMSVDSLPEYDAVIASLEQNTKVSPSLALGFLNNVLPISANFTITSEVSISPILAKYKAIKVTDIEQHLASTESVPFRRTLDRLYQNLARIIPEVVESVTVGA